eukprot:SAG11_NODE_898_length_6638_cov_129.528062_2_plen_1631_part_00
MIASDFMCSCAGTGGPSQPDNISESKVVFYMLFGDSKHGIQTWFIYVTCAVGMSSVFGPIGFRNNSEISVGHPNVFADCVQQSDAFVITPLGLIVLCTVGCTGFIIILAFSVNRGITDRTLRFHSGFQKCQKPFLVRHKRWNLSQLFGMIILCVLLFQSSVESNPVISPAAAQPISTSDNVTSFQNETQLAATKIQEIDSNKLTLGTDFSDPRQLKELFGVFQTQLLQLTKDKQTFEQRLTKDKEALEHQLTNVKEAWENKTQLIETENTALKKRVTSLESTVARLSNKTTTDTGVLKADVEQISIRLDQCQHDSFEHIMDRRRNQEQSSACGMDAVQSMLAVCCSSGPVGNGHRRVQADGCDSLPPTCSLECSSQFISIFENCQGQPVLEQLPPGQLARWTGFLGQCQEVQQSAAELSVADAQPAMIFHCLVLDDAAQSQAEMFGQVSSPVLPVGPLQPIVSPPSPPQASGGGAAQVQEFRRVCTRANLTVCAPPCNQASDGFLLSILIGGRGTMMTCNQEEGVFSWQGQSALGSCITRRAQTWLENIITHAAGTFALELAVSVAVLTAADLVAGQSAMLHGAVGGLAPVWIYSGEGSAFIVGAGAELEISAVVVAATSGLAFRIADSSTITVTSLQLQKGDGSADAISCAALATGVGQAGLTCVDAGFGSVNVAGPLFISTSGTGFGMGATKYMGDDRGVFEEAVSTREPGLYTCQISHDELVTLTLPVESAMHVSIVGDDSMPQWSFTGEGLAFTIAVHAYLNLAYVTVPGGQISLMRGGEVSLDHVQMQGTQLHVGGSLSASNSQLTDVRFETESAAVMTMDAVTLSGTGEEAMTFPIGCSVTISGGEIRNAELQVTSDGELVVTGTAIYVEGMAVSVQTGGSFTISTSQLIHGEITDPFPCNGANMACTGPHAGSVLVSGPASINTAAPLVCADESAGSCLSGYVDMPSCLADIARGMESCFVYLQRDTGELGTISVDNGEHFEIHGNQGEPKLRLLADFDVNGVLILADLQVVGGSGDGSQMSVEAGGELTFERVQMESGGLTVAGVVSLMESSLVEVTVTASSGSELTFSGGTVARSTMTMSSGRMTVDTGCVLIDSPISASGFGGSVMISGAELQSDGSSVQLAVESGGAATVTETTFRSTAGDITAVSVSEGGSMTVGGSRLIGADGSADPFPCDGALPDCAGEHAGSVVVEGLLVVTSDSPLVCDVETGECLADQCLQLFVMGGHGGDDDHAIGESIRQMRSAEVYNTNTGAWSPVASMGGTRYQHGAASVETRIYVTGGLGFYTDFFGARQQTLDDVEVYDAEIGAWSDIAPMGTPRRRHETTATSTHVYAIGGDNGGLPFSTGEAYNIESGVWSPIAPMSTARNQFATAVIGTHIYAMGGSSGGAAPLLSSVEVYNTERNTWSPVTSMLSGRNQFAAAAVGNFIYVTGGYYGSNEHEMSSVEMYDTETGVWSATTSMSIDRYGHEAIALGSRVLVVGGDGHDSPYLSSAEIFDTHTRAWRVITPMIRRRYLGAAAPMHLCSWPTSSVCTAADCQHGTCVLPHGECECSFIDEDRLYKLPWSGQTCSVSPPGLECCNTYGPTHNCCWQGSSGAGCDAGHIGCGFCSTNTGCGSACDGSC